GLWRSSVPRIYRGLTHAASPICSSDAPRRRSSAAECLSSAYLGASGRWPAANNESETIPNDASSQAASSRREIGRPHPMDVHIGMRLRLRRKLAGRSLQELARQMG